MTDSDSKFNHNFDFLIPADFLLEFARNSHNAQNEDLRAVAKAVLDATHEATTVQKAIAANGKVDLAPYFDFWFGDAIEAANRLIDSDDENTRYLAKCVIGQQKAVADSKESFLREMKRLGVEPNRDA